MMHCDVTFVILTDSAGSALFRLLEKTMDGLEEVKDFYSSKSDVKLRFSYKTVPTDIDARVDFKNEKRKFPTVYLHPTETIYGFLGYAFGEFTEIAGGSPYWDYSVIHELGHLFGLSHNIYTVMHPEIARAKQLKLLSKAEVQTIRDTLSGLSDVKDWTFELEYSIKERCQVTVQDSSREAALQKALSGEYESKQTITTEMIESRIVGE